AIIDACNACGAEAILTSINHPTGTDRIAEVARSIKADVYVNVQGDEPLVQPEDIRACAQPLVEDARIKMGSVFADCPDEEVDNPAVVKVVTDINGDALYFSRHAIPFPRNERKQVKKHIGIYAYTADVLQGFSKWPQSLLEKAESLEQL